MSAIQILIADDHAAFRVNLRTLVESHGGLRVCGEAADGEEAVAKAKQLRPEIILMDMSMPRMDGAQATRIIRKEVPESEVIIVSQNDVALVSRQASEVGARSYVSKANVVQELMPAIDAAIAGRKNRKSTQAAVPRQIAADDLSRSEMASLIERKDWSKTSVGAPETWSPALQMMVGLLLANRFPLLLWWGPQYIQFYNDAYKAIPGAKHPHCLGQPANECWSEIWHILKPLIDTPFNGGPSTWSDDLALEIYRSPQSLEETHFTVAYSPVPDTSAPRGIGGVLATVHEITEKIIGERRLALLRDLAARGAEGRNAEEACLLAAQTIEKYPKDVPFVLLYLLDADQKQARLACSAGMADVAGVARHVTIAETSKSNRHWPFSEVFRKNAVSVVKNIASRLPEVPPGPWADPPRSAVVLPIPSSKPHEVRGFLVLGVSVRLRLDEDYHTFFQLIAAQLGTAIANADAYEEERRRAEALAEIDRAKTLFFSNVSHEFRTPLTLMLGPLEDALAAPDSPAAEQRERLEVAHRNSLRLLKLVNTLLDFSRIEAGRIEACYEETNLSQLTAELASVFRSAIERAGLKLIINCEETEHVYVDPEMWEKIVFNLLSNALKFTFTGEIEVAVRRVEGFVELAVRDSGTGIPAQELPHLFERFYRVKGAHGRTFEGSGIGLALVQELTKLHGGTVHVQSEQDQGSTFFVRVPIGKNHLPHDRIGAQRKQTSTGLRGEAYVQEALRWLAGSQSIPQDVQITAPSVAAEPQIEGNDGSRQRSRILLADDNADMREYVRRLLGEKYDVIMVPDGQAAVDSAREHRPDLILTDVMMPRLDGFGLLRELHADNDLKEIPVIVLSARAGEESRVEGLESGADDYLIKPFSARELLARVGSHLAMAKMRREGAELERKLRAEAELERSRLQELFMQAPAAIGVMSGPEHRFTFVNHNYVKLTGRQGSETFVGKTVREAFPELAGQGIFELLDGVYRTGIPYNATARKVILNRGPQGQPEEVYFDFVYQPIRALDGHVEGVLIHAVDVTYKALVHQDVAKRERQFREMIDALPAAIYTTDAEGRLTHFNPAAVEFSGRTPELGTDQWCVSWKLYYPDGRPMPHDECPMAIALKEGRIIKGAEAIAESPDGRRRWFTPFPTPLRDDKGKIVGGINMLLDITERKEAERATRLLAAIVDSSDDAIVSKTLDGTITSWNMSAERLFGYSAEEAIGKPITLIVPWERRSEEEDILKRLARGERLDHLETVRRRKDGSTLDVSLTSSPLRDSTGRVVGASSITRDITERKRIEQALRQSEKKYRDFAETASIALHWVAADGTIIWANRAELELLGYSSNEYIGHNISEFHVDGPVLQDILQRLSMGERIQEYEARLRAKDGSIRYVIIDSSVLFEDGKFIHTRCFTRDVSGRKKAEQALRESEQRLQVVTNATPIMIWMSGTDKGCCYFNKSWLEFVGRTLEDERGNGWAKNVHPDDFDRCLQVYVTSFDARQPFEMEYRLRHHSGQYRWILDHAVPRYAPDGAFEGFVGGCLDVHEQKEAEEALRQSSKWLTSEKEAFQAAINGAPLDVSLGVLIRAAVEQIDGNARGAFHIADASGTTLHHVAGMPEDYAECIDGFRIGADSLACGLAVHTAQPVITPDVTREPRWKQWLWLAEKYDYRGCWSFPVETSVGKIVGTFAMYFKEPREATARDRELASLLAQAAGIIISRHHEAEERVRAENVLRDSEERLRLATEAAKIGAFDLNVQTGVNTWTPELEAMYGLAPGQFDKTQSAWEQLLHPDDRAAAIAKVEETLATGKAVEPEWRVVWPDGSIHWILGRFQCFKDASGKPLRLTGVNIDITARRQAEENYRKLAETLDAEVRARTRDLEERNAEILRQSEQVRELSWRLLRAQDEERRHIARELHDSAGQTLTVLGMNLVQLVQKTGRNAPDLASEAETIQEMVQQLHRDIRTTSYLLHPPLLDESGLSSALSWYTQGLVERSGLQIDLDISQDFGRLPGDMELVVFRLVQECLTNIHRHSGSKRASIRIGREGSQVTVEICDNGNGMTPGRLAEIQSGRSGVGIRGMRERLRQFKGELKIVSGSSGTRISVTIPAPRTAISQDESSPESLQTAI